ncbi:MAG TPA: imidazolonepropionase [Gemmatimonadaceae bacterium]|jgi:imidazolonepropionase|nr:imidazolonepropionase [Gemmatimonadaceae bacterium]
MSEGLLERPTLFVNASQVVTCAGPARARRGSEMNDAGVRTGVGVVVAGGRIVAVDSVASLHQRYKNAPEIDCRQGVLTPGLVDSHTHGIFGRPRFDEQEMRAAGLDYMEIARRGGGIHSSVRDLRAQSEESLLDLARVRLRRLSSFGSTTVELKSGYGLTLEDELKTLRVIAQLSRELPLRIVATFLGAHEIPLEHRGSAAARQTYVDSLINEMIPAVSAQQLARFADVFCETGVYTVDESRAILTAARDAGLLLKLHADELTSSGGAELAASLGATSADHLAAISDGGIAALAHASTVATLLPGTMLFLGKTKHAPARRLIEAGIAVALATDFNPGTSPTPNLPLVLTLGVSQLRLSVAEAVVAATVNGASALALADHVGQIAPGFSADLALFDIGDIRELPYWYGDNRCVATYVRGKPCYTSDLAIT